MFEFLYEPLMGYTYWYYLGHPIKFIKACFREVKWAWQRVFRGWDDRVSWDISYYLNKNLPLWLEEVISHSDAMPMIIYEEAFQKAYIDGLPHGTPEDRLIILETGMVRWHGILQEIADGIRSFEELDELVGGTAEYDKVYTKYHKALLSLIDIFDNI